MPVDDIFQDLGKIFQPRESRSSVAAADSPPPRRGSAVASSGTGDGDEFSPARRRSRPLKRDPAAPVGSAHPLGTTAGVGGTAAVGMANGETAANGGAAGPHLTTTAHANGAASSSSSFADDRHGVVRGPKEGSADDDVAEDDDLDSVVALEQHEAMVRKAVSQVSGGTPDVVLTPEPAAAKPRSSSDRTEHAEDWVKTSGPRGVVEEGKTSGVVEEATGGPPRTGVGPPGEGGAPRPVRGGTTPTSGSTSDVKEVEEGPSRRASRRSPVPPPSSEEEAGRRRNSSGKGGKKKNDPCAQQ